MIHKIVILPRDGVDPEISNGSLELLEIVSKKYNFTYNSKSYGFGGAAVGAHSTPLPGGAPSICQEVDAILLGTVEGPKWIDPNSHSEQGLLALRKKLGLSTSIRPTRVTESTNQFSPLRETRVKHTGLVIIHELTGSIYFNEPRHINHPEVLDPLIYTRAEIEHIAKIAFELAHTRNKKVTSVDRENVLTSGKLWRKIVTKVSKSYPGVELNHLLVDACSMHLITHPSQFDVIVTESLFGDILSDEASVVPGSLSLSSSANFSEHDTRLYEPIHSSTPNIANQNPANPFGIVLSLAMCLGEGLDQSVATEESKDAVYHLIKVGKTTKGLGGHYKTSEIFELLKRSHR